MMKLRSHTRFGLIGLLMLCSIIPLSAQVEGVTRKAMTIHKRPLSRVPVLAIEKGSVQF